MDPGRNDTCPVRFRFSDPYLDGRGQQRAGRRPGHCKERCRGNGQILSVSSRQYKNGDSGRESKRRIRKDRIQYLSGMLQFGRGYYEQEGDELVCQNCGNRFRFDKVEIIKGGCNPVPIAGEYKTDDGTNITIPQAFLQENKALFGNWSK